MRRIKCINCESNEMFFQTKCDNCGAFLQDRIPNISFFSTSYSFLISPTETLIIISRANNKNYQVFLFILIQIKILLLFALLFNSFNISSAVANLSFTQYFSNIIITYFIILIYVFILKLFIANKNKLFFRSFLSTFVFSLLPLVWSFLLIPLELAVFDTHFFEGNPSIFIINSSVAWGFLIFEMIFIFYSLFLLIKFLSLFFNNVSVILLNFTVLVILSLSPHIFDLQSKILNIF